MIKSTKYDHLSIQKKWNSKWEDAKIYHPNLDTAKNPFYALYMFPYPSAEGLHMGHAFSGTGADVYARFKRMKGEDVFQPMGFDAFGIHSENFALKIGDHPQNLIDRATKHFREQFDSLGFSYDWDHSVNTSSPDYYKWTQWLFIQLFKAGLAEKKKAEVNWCPSCKTVLADEQVLSGECERCGSIVEKKELEQWFFKITDYADRLLEGLSRIDWTPKVLTAQRNWIGKSEGAKIRFVILEGAERPIGSQKDSIAPFTLSETEGLQNDNFVEVFTTRPDTLFGATFLVLSPEHPVVARLLNVKYPMSNIQLGEVREYVERARKRSEQDLEKEKTGVFSGFYAVNPATKQRIPIWIADYVLMGYGTGAIMAVPAHDQRDFEFAKKYDLPIRAVILSPSLRSRVNSTKDLDSIASPGTGQYLAPLQNDKGEKPQNDNMSEAYVDEGQIIDSGDWTGWDSSKDFGRILDWLEEKEIGKRETHYHLRDWLISRQRYWGAPIPMVKCEKDGWVPVDEKDLPVLLPYIENFKPLGTGVAPLAQDKDFVNTTCPVCKGPATRETDVADTFLDSSWYFLRYPATDLADIPFPSENWRDYLEKTDGRKSKMEDRDPKIENGRSINPQSSTIKNPSSTIHDLSSSLELEIENSARRAAWLPVNSYIGGAEHSVLHLLYSRFVTKALFDQKLLDFDEPFTKFRAHGLIIKDGAKMSKSKGNVVNPDEYIAKYGADALRCYLMFLGPYEAGGDFRDSGIEGMERFLKRVKKLVEAHSASSGQESLASDNQSSEASAKISPNTNLDKSMNKAIKGVGDDVESLRYNTSLAKIMEYVNDLTASKENIETKHLKTLVLLLAPFAPYLAEELWSLLNGLTDYGSQTTAGVRAAVDGSPFAISVHQQPWPEYDPKMIEDDEINVAVQINGKLRSVLSIKYQVLSKDDVEKIAKEDPKISAQLEGKEVKKVIYVAGKIINFVV